MNENLIVEIWLNFTTWWVDLLSFALISFSTGNLKITGMFSLKIIVYQIYPSYGEFKINKYN